jgi:hypothetical protein
MGCCNARETVDTDLYTGKDANENQITFGVNLAKNSNAQDKQLNIDSNELTGTNPSFITTNKFDDQKSYKQKYINCFINGNENGNEDLKRKIYNHQTNDNNEFKLIPDYNDDITHKYEESKRIDDNDHKSKNYNGKCKKY